MCYTYNRRPEAVFKYFFIIKLNMEKLINYLKSSYAEMRKVTWPTKKQTFTYSMIVIGMSVGFAAFFSILDYIFKTGIAQALLLK